MLPGLDRELLGRQTERIHPHRVQDVLAPHALVARDNVGCDEPQRMPHMQALAGRVGEHVEKEEALTLS